MFVKQKHSGLMTCEKSQLSNIEYGTGFFSSVWLVNRINMAHRYVDVLMIRNLSCSTPEVLTALQKAARRGVKLRLMSLSPEVSELILNVSFLHIPSPKCYSADHLREELTIYQQLMLKQVTHQWKPDEREQYQYKTYDHVPGAQSLRCDEQVFFGNDMMFFGGQLSEPDDRPYVHTSLKTPVGFQVMRHFQQLWLRAYQVYNGTTLIRTPIKNKHVIDSLYDEGS